MTRISELTALAQRMRRHILEMIAGAGSGHPGGSLSSVELVTALYFAVMRLDPGRPDWPERDRFVLSKGHAAPVLYAALAERGFFPVEELTTLRRLGSRLQGHPDMTKTPGVDASTGSLGQGLSIALGMALAARLDGSPRKVYCLLGDGELQEGQVWEAAMAAAHYQLDNLIACVDYNGVQLDGPLAEIMSVQPLAAKWQAFGWRAVEIDGHDMAAVLAALEGARETRGVPSVIIARTVKGKGVSFMEGSHKWHGVAPDRDQLATALAEVGGDGE